MQSQQIFDIKYGPFALFTRHHQIKTPIGIRQGTGIAKKVLKLRSQRIAKAVVDIKSLSAIT